MNHRTPIVAIDGRAVETANRRWIGAPNGEGAKLRGQGPRGYGRTSRRLPAF
jgi:hypothetical protein